MILPRWPNIALPERAIRGPWITGAARSGGRSLLGTDQRNNASGGGYWRYEIDLAVIHDVDAIRAYRALVAGMDGGSSPIVVPILDGRQAPWPTGVAGAVGGIPHSDGTLFDDGTGYVNAGISAEANADFDLGATTMVVVRTSMASLMGGEYFTVFDDEDLPRLHIVTRVVTGGINQQIEFRPPLRGAVAAGDALDFADPRCVMTLADPDGAALGLRDHWIGEPSISFVEDL